VFHRSISSPDGITEKRVDHHRENAVVLVFRGILWILMGNVESGVFPFYSVLFGGCFPIVSPMFPQVTIMGYKTIIYGKSIQL
jgi:hypothetical protein